MRWIRRGGARPLYIPREAHVPGWSGEDGRRQRGSHVVIARIHHRIHGEYVVMDGHLAQEAGAGAQAGGSEWPVLDGSRNTLVGMPVKQDRGRWSDRRIKPVGELTSGRCADRRAATRKWAISQPKNRS